MNIEAMIRFYCQDDNHFEKKAKNDTFWRIYSSSHVYNYSTKRLTLLIEATRISFWQKIQNSITFNNSPFIGWQVNFLVLLLYPRFRKVGLNALFHMLCNVCGIYTWKQLITYRFWMVLEWHTYVRILYVTGFLFANSNAYITQCAS